MKATLQFIFLTFLLVFCFNLQATSTPFDFDGGEIYLPGGATEIEICAGDGIPDPLNVIRENWVGMSTAWVITDDAGIILAIAENPPFDLEGAGGGTCLIWHLAIKDIVGPFEVGMHKDDVYGWLDYSNSITVVREAISASVIDVDGATELETCVGDGIPDPFTVNVDRGIGNSAKFLVTDEDLNILAISNSNEFDFEEAGEGTCLVWHLTFNNIAGNVIGLNAGNLIGCFQLSNPVTVYRRVAEGADISLEDGSTEIEICAGDGVSDAFTPIVEGGSGVNNQWVITDEDLTILGLPGGSSIDLDGAGEGVCLVWYLLYNGEVSGLELGNNAGDVTGCLEFSNPITVTRVGIAGGAIELEGGGTELSTCAGDGISDAFTVTASDNIGKNTAWVVTDTDLNILAIPPGPTFDFEEAGAGTCLVWLLSYNGNINGAEVGANAADLEGCFALSNAVTVLRSGVEAASIATEGLTEIETCAGDGIGDPFTVEVTGGMSESSAWVITDEALNILALPEGPTFDLEGAGEGTCLVWYLSYNGMISGAEVGANAGDLEGCFVLSNAITVVRKGVAGGMIALEDGGTELSICAGDGVADPFTPELTDAQGERSAWVITDDELNILALPEGPTFDLEGAGGGVCLLWHLSFNGDITGAEVGANAGDLAGCFSLSNAITVTRSGVEAASIASDGQTEIETCAGDGESDAFIVDVTGGMGESSAWVITDEELNILALPEGATIDLEGAGEGVCLVWYLNYNGDIIGAEVGANAGDLEGCFVLSNAITVTRKGVAGGMLSLEGGGTELEICAGDGVADPFTPVLEGAVGENSAWVITDEDLNILALPEGPTFDLEGAGAGVCLVWYLAFNGEITGAEVGANAGDLAGCFALSNAISVTRSGVEGGMLTFEGGDIELETCVGDGIGDPFTPVIEGAMGENSAWVVTDVDGLILALPAGPTFDFEEAGAGTCLVWHLSFNGEIMGAEVGNNASDLAGCFALSNAITVSRDGISASDISLEGGGTELTTCVGDGIADPFTVIVEGGMGNASAWVITDEDLNILALPEGPSFDLEGAGPGTCLVWYLSFNGEIMGAEVGANAADLAGCFALSNAITVFREEIGAATIAIEGGGTDLEICAGDGVADPFTVMTEGGISESSAWVITDEDLNILALPEGPTFDLEGAGEGTCLVWYLSFNGELTGAEVGANAADLAGCFALSNAITVVRKGVSGGTLSLEGGGSELTICAGDGISDAFTPLLEGAMGDSSAWVITDADLNILALPEGPSFDLEGAGGGTCLVWHLSFNGEITGAEVGANAGDLAGCLSLSNAITVVREGVAGGSIANEFGVTAFSTCVGDGISDAFTATLMDAEGEGSAWVITDTMLNILALPEGPTFDLEGAGPGVCLVWHVSFNGELSGAEVGANAADLGGCFALSNAIRVDRQDVAGSTLSLEGGGTELSICAGDGVSDAFTPLVEGGIGEKTAWVITDADANILALPLAPPFDLEGAGAGVCLVWQLSYNGSIFGIEVGANAADIEGCTALSNPITVTRTEVGGGMLSLENGDTELTICAGDGVSDSFNVVIDSFIGENQAWVITDEDGNILGLPESAPFDLEGAGAGVCLVWHLAFNGEIMGAEVGANAEDLVGCFALSNPITVTRVTEGDLCGGILQPKHVDIFPNPSNDFITVNSALRLNKDFQVSIYDMMGRKVKDMNQLNQYDMKIDIQDLEAGVYYLSIGDSEKSTMKQFVKIK